MKVKKVFSLGEEDSSRSENCSSLDGGALFRVGMYLCFNRKNINS